MAEPSQPILLPTQWNLSKLYYTGYDDPQFKKDKEAVEHRVNTFFNTWSDRDDWLAEPVALQKIMQDYEQLVSEGESWGKPAVYTKLRQYLSSSEGEVLAQHSSTEQWSVNLNTKLTFFNVRLAKVAVDKRQIFLKAPELQKWHHYLERIFQEAEHTLGEEAEKVLGLVRDTSYGKWKDMLEAFLEQEEPEVVGEDGKTSKVPFSALSNLLSSNQKEVRDAANQALLEVADKHTAVAEKEINALLQFHYTTDLLRDYSRPEAARLLADDIEPAIVDEMLAEVKAAYSPIVHRYFKLKSGLVDQEKLAYHERYMPYGDTNLNFSYEEAFALVQQVFAQLDPSFAAFISGLVHNGQVDVYPALGKRSGAFCWYAVPSLPIHILLNFTGKIHDVTTMAHEFGHAINDWLMSSHLMPLDINSPLCTAEVASTFFESYVMKALLAKADPSTRLHLLVEYMDRSVATIFHQAAGFSFEQDLHRIFREKGYLTEEEIGKLFRGHMEAYLGPAVDCTNSQKRWVTWPHLRVYFYIYSYVMGDLISLGLQSMVEQNPQDIKKVKKFLAAGSSAAPQHIFADLGIDITDASFWRAGLTQLEGVIGEIEALAAKLGK